MKPVGSEASNQEDAILTPEIPAVVAVDWGIDVDGDLREWGAGQHIALDPGGDHVGLRGVFGGWPEYEAVVSTYWDAENLYIAAAITDDVLDAGMLEARHSADRRLDMGQQPVEIAREQILAE